MTTPPLPRFAELQAPPAWRVVDFISDLHLQADAAATFNAWRRYLADTPAQAIFILGDLFEVWPGDDAADAPGFEQDCRDALTNAAGRCAVFFMSGNRDFLLSAAFLNGCHARGLADPTVLAFAGQRWLLSHGDALCLEDTRYQRFRAEVRAPAWQQSFLARPLAERRAMARVMRQQSEAVKQGAAPGDFADVDASAACRWLKAARASQLIHGHTHRPGDHALECALPDGNQEPGAVPGSFQRRVLSDWDADAEPPRLQVLRGTAQGFQRINLAPV